VCTFGFQINQHVGQDGQIQNELAGNQRKYPTYYCDQSRGVDREDFGYGKKAKDGESLKFYLGSSKMFATECVCSHQS
jgi:hypothetical protein